MAWPNHDPYRVVPISGAWTRGGTITPARSHEAAAADVQEQINNLARDGYRLVSILHTSDLGHPLAIFEQVEHGA